ncbi:MAG: double zinc ribbon domain-containing protein, partial [Eubacteriales bacterium]
MGFRDFIVNIFFPASCAVCGSAVKTGGSVCRDCIDEFRREMFFRCPNCGNTADKCQCVTGSDTDFGRKTEIGGKRVLSLTFYLNSYRRGDGRV